MTGVSEWLQRHDLTIDLITIWTVVVSAVIIASGFAVAWWTLRGTHDQTAVGRALKWQKITLAFAFTVNAAYWGVVLAAYYTGYIVGLWEKAALRFLFSGGMLTGAVVVFWFVRTLRKEIHREQQWGTAPLAGHQPDE